MDKGKVNIFAVLFTSLLAAIIVGGGLYLWQTKLIKVSVELPKKEKEVPLPTGGLPSVIVSSPIPTTDPYIGWLTYKNNVYNYQFKYPSTATVEEATKEAFSLSPEEVAAGMTFDEKFAKYTGKICLSVSYQLGYINISAPVNKDFAHVICGRTGVVYETAAKTEPVIINGKTYTANGYEERGPGETLDKHNETMVVILDDGTRIEYGSKPDSAHTFAEYLGIRSTILKIVSSYQKI